MSFQPASIEAQEPAPRTEAQARDLRPIGPAVRAICIAAGEKALRRLNTKAARLSSELDRLRQDGTISDSVIDTWARDLSDCQAEIEGFEAQLAALKAVRA